MSLPLVFPAEVKGEVDDACAWYERQREGLGEEFLAEVEEVLNRVQQNPEAHAVIYRGVRRALVRRFSYAVYYRLDPTRIEVIAVQHSKRDPTRWRSRT
jgi:plasmid stabilization system protein ParE